MCIYMCVYVCVYVSMYICMHTYSPNHHFPVVFSLKAWCHHSFSPLKTPVGAPASQHPLVDLLPAPQGGMRIEWIKWRLNRIDWHVIIHIFGLYFIYIIIYIYIYNMFCFTTWFILWLFFFAGNIVFTSKLVCGGPANVSCRPTGLS